MIDLLKAYGVKIIETDEEAAKLLDRDWLDVHPMASLTVLAVAVAVLAFIGLRGVL